MNPVRRKILAEAIFDTAGFVLCLISAVTSTQAFAQSSGRRWLEWRAARPRGFGSMLGHPSAGLDELCHDQHAATSGHECADGCCFRPDSVDVAAGYDVAADVVDQVDEADQVDES